ncbi:predicted protein [Uncinocarpus reesii 1704]|uniref:Homeobox domain-containing protein n=1 Tax=Uncinocarpus reesii (strain UAMH 1704) TaxID=336963 RepID=C4JPV1_UNCRE|nr:uncharacterized protein UREG_04594 [Uncinocarpus reesii 1704]EEP79748.1 predicted protein [Uncinocarpus reesii 1704]
MSDTDCTHTGSEPSFSNDIERNSPNNGSFLVHSNKTFTHGQPPKVDNKILGRQRRRRTSPEDYAILEAEYQRNPKPDKVTRASIVSRVSLGDKEVQIWFQNRRQNDRRRSKPLPTHETGSSIPKTPNAANTDTQKGKSEDEADTNLHCPNRSLSPCDDPEVCPQRASSSAAELSSEHRDNESEESDSLRVASSQDTVATIQTERLEGICTSVDALETPTTQVGAPHSDQQSSGRKRKWDEIDVDQSVEAKYARRSLPSQLATPPSLRISLSFDGEAMVRLEGEKTPSPPKPRDSLRISFSADGEAVVRTASEPSPSKSTSVQARQARFAHLRRSASAIAFPTIRGTVRGKDQKSFGRSRDARTWELHCDDDARTALSTALNTRTDSAARDSLWRRDPPLKISKPLAPGSDLHNESSEPQVPAGKRKKLTRAMSSLARLETGTKAPISSGKKSKTFGNEMNENSGDSDKENWIPGTQISSARTRATQKQPIRSRGRRVLGQSSKQLEAKPTGARLKRARSAKMSRGNTQQEECDAAGEHGEVPGFLKVSESNPEEDLDCVQGLLSLSQGAWR